jgi:prevent-host-death family protein
MKQLNLAEAKARFSELVDAAARGDGTIIAKSGTPVAMLVPLDREKRAPIKFGTLKCKIWIAENFDDPLPDDVLEEFEKGGGPLSLDPPNEIAAGYADCAVGRNRGAGSL